MRQSILVYVVLILMWLPVPAASQPASGIAGSDHDFSGTSAGGAEVTGTCTFCHTPHKAAQTRLLWNHSLSPNTFSWSDATSTIGGTTLPSITPSWSGPSKFCLACHDGSVAVGDILWFSGSAWTGAAALDLKKLDTGQDNIASPSGMLDGNHPVAHPYPYLGAGNTYNGTTTGSAVDLVEFNPDPTTSGIQLFNDAAGNIENGPVSGNTGIECSSCHDPHNGSKVQDKYFLLGELGGNGPNYICTKCHIK
ncbi:MAG: hypothetical protein ACE5F7_06385 [Nitrospiria bacterium]